MIVEYIYSGQISVGQNNLDSFLSAAKYLQISGLDYLKTEVDMSSGPQDLSMKTCHNTNKRRRVEGYYSGDSCLPSNVQHKKTETHNNSLGQAGYAMKGLLEPKLEIKVGGINNSLDFPSGIFPANLQKMDETIVRKSKLKDPTSNSKIPLWSQSQLQEAIESVITQQLRFTQASIRYGIPKGTLYDNILGKSKRMVVLDQVGLTETQELSVLEFCCEISSMPYNRRTSRSLADIIKFITHLKKEEGKKEFQLSRRQGFRWWWAFTKKHSIISLYYHDNGEKEKPPNIQERKHSSSPDNILNILNNKPSLSINIPSPSNYFLPLLALNSESKYSFNHPDFRQPPKAHAHTF